MRITLANELERVRAARTPEMSAEVKAALTAAEAAILAAAASMDKVPED